MLAAGPVSVHSLEVNFRFFVVAAAPNAGKEKYADRSPHATPPCVDRAW